MNDRNDTTSRPRRALFRDRSKRRFVRATMTAALILFVIWLAGEIVFATQWPRGIIITNLEHELGLRIHAQSVYTGWFGETDLNQVTVQLPLSDRAFLEVPKLKVRNGTLFTLAFGGKPRIYGLDFRQPHLTVYQGADGRWNLQELAEIRSSENSNTPTRVTLPSLRVEHATVTIHDRAGGESSIEPLDITGHYDTAISWAFVAHVASRLEIKGRFAPGGAWLHEVTVDLSSVAPWIKPWSAEFPENASLNAHWRGQLGDGALSGRLDLANLTFGQFQSFGTVNAAFRNGLFSVNPIDLTVRSTDAAWKEAIIRSGTVSYDGRQAIADRLELRAADGPIRLSGRYDRGTESGELHAAWEQLALPGQVRHGGTLDLSLTQPFPSRYQLQGSLVSNGSTPSGPWQAQVAMSLQGSGWRDLDWQLSATKLVYQRRHPIRLDGTAVSGSLRPRKQDGFASPVLTINSITRPGDGLTGRGWYDFSSRAWVVNVQGPRWPFHPLEEKELRFAINAFGDRRLVHLQEFSLHGEDMDFVTVGEYRYGIPKPLEVKVSLTNHPQSADLPDRAFLKGVIAGQLTLKGTLWPLMIGVEGNLSGRGVTLGTAPLADVDLVTSGTIDRQLAQLHTETLRLLGGNWILRGFYSFEEAAASVWLDVNGLSLKEAGTLAGSAPIAGTLDGRFNLYVPGLRPHWDTLKLQGDATVSHLVSGELAVDTIRGHVAMQGGVLIADPLTLSRGDVGRGKGHVLWDVQDPRQIVSGIALTAWPVAVPGTNGEDHLWLSADPLTIRLPDGAAADAASRGLQLRCQKIDLNTNLTVHDQPFGVLHASGALLGRSLEVRELSADAAGGTFSGAGSVSFDNPNSARLRLNWDGVQSDRLVELTSLLGGMRGTLKGQLLVHPAPDARALGPLDCDLQNGWTRGAYRNIPLKDIHIHAFAELTNAPLTLQRFVFADTPVQDSVIHFGSGGEAELWARASRHDRDLWGIQSQLKLTNLDLDEFAHAFDARAVRTPGRLAGTITILYDTSNSGSNKTSTNALEAFLRNVYLQSDLRLTRSNLANTAIISFLYTAMNLGRDIGRPTGRGAVSLHVESGTLNVTRLDYFNRGTEVHAAGQVRELWKLKDSPVTGSAVGSAQPLRNIKLPLVPDLNLVLGTLQSELTSVSLGGTIDKIDIRPVPFRGVGEALRSLVLGNVRGGAGSDAQ